MAEKSNGIVIGGLVGICSTILYGGCGCIRPGPKDWLPGTTVTSSRETVDGICEHFDVHVIDDAGPQMKEPGAPADSPVDAATIEKAKIPPPVKHVGSPPPQAGAAVDGQIEPQFDGELSSDERRELLAAMQENSRPTESTGKPTSAFSAGFDEAPKARRPGKPVSAFDR